MPDPQELLIEIEDEQNLDIELNDEQNIDVDLDYDVVTISGVGVYSDTTAHWNEQREYIAEKDKIYVYVDYKTIDGKPVPGIKMGDGTSYLIDMPFVAGNSTVLDEHIRNKIVHITQDEREFWNNKVTCYVSPADHERLIFSKAKEE